MLGLYACFFFPSSSRFSAATFKMQFMYTVGIKLGPSNFLKCCFLSCLNLCRMEMQPRLISVLVTASSDSELLCSEANNDSLSQQWCEQSQLLYAICVSELNLQKRNPVHMAFPLLMDENIKANPYGP